MQNFRIIKDSFEELLLLSIIILTVLNFFGFLNPNLVYLRELIFVITFGYLMYKICFSKIFFGYENKKLDMMILISFFILSLKTIISYSQIAIDELSRKGLEYWAKLYPAEDILPINSMMINLTSPLNKIDISSVSNIPVGNAIHNVTKALTLYPQIPLKGNIVYLSIANDIGSKLYVLNTKFFIHRWHNFILENSYVIQEYSFIIGGLLLLFIALYSAIKLTIKEPSLLAVIQEHTEPVKTFTNILKKTLIIFIMLNFFYSFVFDLAFEWFLLIDAHIIIISILFYFLIWLKYHDKFDADSVIYKIGNSGHLFFRRIMMLFYTKKGILIALSGMLVFHLLVDIGNFLIPFTFGTKNIYIQALGPGHEPLLRLAGFASSGTQSLLSIDMGLSGGIIEKFSIMYVYLTNLIGVTLLFTGPIILWYILFKKKTFVVPRVMVSIFYGSVISYLLLPLLFITRARPLNIVGIDVQTQSISQLTHISVYSVVIVSLIVGVMTYILGKRFKNQFFYGMIALTLLFFGLYIYNFFLDLSNYYVTNISSSIIYGEYFVGVYLFFFLGLTILFYLGGFIFFVYESFS